MRRSYCTGARISVSTSATSGTSLGGYEAAERVRSNSKAVALLGDVGGAPGGKTYYVPDPLVRGWQSLGKLRFVFALGSACLSP